MYLNKILKYKYNIDKLHIKFECSNTQFDKHDENFHVVPMYLQSNYKRYKIYDSSDGIELGELEIREMWPMTLKVDNRFLYSRRFDILYKFIETFGLRIRTFAHFEICCDANVNLPYKLNRLLNDKKFTILRNRKPLPRTPNGNIYLGKKVIPIIRVEMDKEKKYPTYYFDALKTKGCAKCPAKLVGYNKSEEVKISDKQYILDAIDFGDETIHRLEVRTNGYEMKQSGIDLNETLYNLGNYDYLRWLYLLYLDRFYSFVEGKTIHNTSELLRLA